MLFEKNIDTKLLSPLSLAFIGDAVYELYVRTFILSGGNTQMSKANIKKQQLVSAKYQSLLIEKLIPLLTEDEIAVYKRGRNAKVSNIPKNAQISDYHSATGFEALIGYLYLQHNIPRIEELLMGLTPQIDN